MERAPSSCVGQSCARFVGNERTGKVGWWAWEWQGIVCTPQKWKAALLDILDASNISLQWPRRTVNLPQDAPANIEPLIEFLQLIEPPSKHSANFRTSAQHICSLIELPQIVEQVQIQPNKVSPIDG
jgi:hypothetical protein